MAWAGQEPGKELNAPVGEVGGRLSRRFPTRIPANPQLKLEECMTLTLADANPWRHRARLPNSSATTRHRDHQDPGILDEPPPSSSVVSVGGYSYNALIKRFPSRSPRL